MKPQEIQEHDFTDILFEGRNKSYGAYKLRRLYGQHVIKALSITIAAFLLVIFSPDIISLFHKDITLDQDQVVQVDMPPSSTMVLPEYVPPPPPAPVKNTPPKIVKDSLPQKKPIEKKVEDKETASTGKTDSASKTTQNTGSGSGAAGDGDNALYGYADTYPSFPGGIEAMKRFLQTHIVYPPEEAQQMIGGVVMVSVIINKDGTLTDIHIVKGINRNLDAEALRVVKLMPAWNPGRLKEQPIRFITRIPVRFSPR